MADCFQREWNFLEGSCLRNMIKEYFSNIAYASRSLFNSMRITFHYWIKEPSITIEYPDRLSGKKIEDFIPDRYRGFLGLNADKCIGCLQCFRTCPINCILIKIVKKGDVRHIIRFDVDQSKCMYCGLCVEICPADALIFTKRFEGASYSIKDLCSSLIKDDIPIAKGAQNSAGADR